MMRPSIWWCQDCDKQCYPRRDADPSDPEQLADRSHTIKHTKFIVAIREDILTDSIKRLVKDLNRTERLEKWRS